MRFFRSMTFLIALVCLGCGEPDYEDQFAAFEKYVKKQQLGSTPDVWLVRINVLGEPERVALIFGMWGDEEYCLSIVDLFRQRWQDRNYRCEIAN